ncbi:MAG: AMP-binding protein [Burkholderiaceae bacterium]
MPAEPAMPVLLHDLLTRQHENPAIALRDAGHAMSYQAMHRHAVAIAHRLLANGVSPGDRVAIYLPKGLLECCALFAASLAGAVFVPVNPLLKGPQLAHIVGDCEARVLIADDALWAAAQADLAGAGLAPVVLPASSLSIDDSPPFAGGPDGDAGRQSDPALAAATARVLGEDLAAILYTSGSTGRPKGVMLTHANLLAGARIVRTYLGISAADRLLSILPLSFDYGLNQLITTVEQGAELVPFTFRFGDEIVSALARYQITGMAGVPTIWAILTQAAPSLRKTPLPGLRYITNSGGPVPSKTVSRLRELLPQTGVVLMYGLTEAFRSTWLDPRELDRRPTSIGKAIPECEVFVVTEDGRRAAPGEPGILVHRGPTVSRGYWRRPQDTARVLRPNPLRPADEGADTVCWSGDLVTMDDEGFLYFVGRNDAMIKSSGYRISPAEVEEALMASGRLRQVAVIGLPDPVIGQRVHAIAIALDGDAPPDVRALLRECAATLPAYMLPRDIELVDALPLSPNGKVDHKALAAARAPAAASNTVPGA